jgi:hypothetical protein
VCGNITPCIINQRGGVELRKRGRLPCPMGMVSEVVQEEGGAVCCVVYSYYVLAYRVVY